MWFWVGFKFERLILVLGAGSSGCPGYSREFSSMKLYPFTLSLYYKVEFCQCVTKRNYCFYSQLKVFLSVLAYSQLTVHMFIS